MSNPYREGEPSSRPPSPVASSCACGARLLRAGCAQCVRCEREAVALERTTVHDMLGGFAFLLFVLGLCASTAFWPKPPSRADFAALAGVIGQIATGMHDALSSTPSTPEREQVVVTVQPTFVGATGYCLSSAPQEDGGSRAVWVACGGTPLDVRNGGTGLLNPSTSARPVGSADTRTSCEPLGGPPSCELSEQRHVLLGSEVHP